MEDILSQMMGGGHFGGFGGGRPQRRSRGKDVGVEFPVSLEDLYKGKSASIPYERQVLCRGCKGSGSSKAGSSAVCTACRGRGVRMMTRQMGPGMIQQMQVQCDACGGQGSAISEKDKCKTCFMRRVESVQSPLALTIEPGMTNKQQIPFRGKGDESPDYDAPGDVIVVLKEEEHHRFKRDGNDLKIISHIPLAQALCGVNFSITHLDGRVINVKSTKEEIISQKVIRCIKGEGMPVWKGSKMEKGDLVIEFNIDFPRTLDDEQLSSLRQALPSPPANQFQYDTVAAEKVTVIPSPVDDMRRTLEKLAAEEEDEDENTGGGGGVQCASH